MPEISDSDYRTFVTYQTLGSPSDISKKIDDLEKDNRKYRTEEKPALEAKIPKDGEVVVPKAKADAIEAFEAIGKKPEEITAALTEGDQAKAKLAEVEWERSASAAAEAAGLKPKAFLLLPGVKEHTFEIRTEKGKDGKDVKRAYLKKAGDTNAQPVLLDRAYVDGRDDWKELAPALVGSSSSTEDTGTRWAEQRNGDGPAGYDPRAAGKKMAEQAKAGAADGSLAFK